MTATALMLGQAVSAQAIEPEDILAPTVGRVVIIPHVSLAESYNDNVFLLNDDQETVDDLVTKLSPGISLQYGENILDNNFIGFDYTLSQRWFAENSELNRDRHDLDLAINYIQQGKYRFTGNDLLSMEKTLAVGRERTNQGSWGAIPGKKHQQIERKLFDRRYRFEYTVSQKTSVYANTSYNGIDYGEEPHYYFEDVFGATIPYSFYDVATWINTVGFGWQAFDKIKLYGSFFYGITGSETNLERMEEKPDSVFFGGHISAIGNFTEKLSGQVLFGYQIREIDYRSSHNNFIYNIRLEYRYTPKGIVSLGYDHRGTVSIYGPDRAVTRDDMILLVTQQIGTTGKLSAALQANYELETETQNALKYQHLIMTTGISYRFNDWLVSSLMYGFSMYEADESNVDYAINRVTFGLSVGYFSPFSGRVR